MTEWDREIFIDIELDVRIRYCRTDHPPVRYAVMLEVSTPAGWTTARLWDNAHSADDHHEHGYTREEGKQAAVTRSFASVNEAMAAAIRKATNEWQAILEGWRAGT
jgi:hypothetical protein